MLTGSAPFSGKTDSGVYRKIRKGQWWRDWSELSQLPTMVICLLADLMATAPLKRPTVLDLRRQIREIESLHKAGNLYPTTVEELTAARPQLASLVLNSKKEKLSTKKQQAYRKSHKRNSRVPMSNLTPIMEE